MLTMSMVTDDVRQRAMYLFIVPYWMYLLKSFENQVLGIRNQKEQ